MYRGYQDWNELEDELYKEEEDSEGSEVNSELEFQLYSQLHYSSIAGELEDNEEDGGDLDEGTEEKEKVEVGQQLKVLERTGDGNGEHNGLEENHPVSHDEGGLRKHHEGTAELHERKRKNQEKLKVVKCDDVDERRRFSSAFIKEVIVIDSSPEDISISGTDSDDDSDDGVCSIKGRTPYSRPLLGSTPSQTTPQKRKSSSSLESIVVLDSEDSSAEPERSGSVSDSDSDGLENWMILGSGKEEGDQSISLNLEGVPDNNTDGGGCGGGDNGGVRWSVSNKDRKAQICNKVAGLRLLGNRGAGSNRYFVDKNVTCHNCNKTGHLSKTCPTPKKVVCFLCGSSGHSSYDCPNKHCNNCGLPGHLYESCSERAYWHKQCHRCGITGHYLDACPEIWRQYHITPKAGPPVRPKGDDPGRNPPYCHNCSRRGHFGHACTMPRMFRGTFANTPFINHYDSRDDIKRRNNRINFKQLNIPGQLSTSQTPETPGPPKKRQKSNHNYKSDHQDPNHHSNHRSHQSPIIHKHNNTHIRFNDGRKSATKFKPKKEDKQKQQGSSGPGKRWEPKRQVPTTRDPLPPARPAKVALDEADDFPRGKGEGEKKKRKKIKKSSKGPPGVPFKPNACTSDRLFGPGRAGDGKKNTRVRGRDRKKAAATEMYPTDENLFIIKQRKGKKR